MISSLGEIAKDNPFGVVGGFTQGAATTGEGVADLSFDNQIIAQIGNLQGAQAQVLQDQINAAIIQLNQQVNSSAAAMATGMATLREDINNISAGTAALTTDKNTAAYYAGKASGADVWQCSGAGGAPTECVSHVNTVLNRRYDGTLLRYQAALKDAKALGYLARESIEQRLGIRLTDITTPIGTLPAPSTWADDVCHLTGVDYKKLANDLPDAGSASAQKAFDSRLLPSSQTNSSATTSRSSPTSSRSTTPRTRSRTGTTRRSFR